MVVPWHFRVHRCIPEPQDAEHGAVEDQSDQQGLAKHCWYFLDSPTQLAETKKNKKKRNHINAIQ